ncbi:Multidrug/Oligosaccharidyl-lipid/Polysaccharide (MOP) Flippase Superfamily [Thraustotheca clavata]|uniref:Multidrug/Oligosaccharidyl-lipid/Polysaccharide (MOP) Flippase Superfamily n=1 Tax=Thraustotheca clavata TaxID=74557 RepID=A0A1V9YU26_9STRA|nr:Multidrug/Oligosaccharidyl-lipid/Polysaccharide (MOP) Flippase Superfamily [Thraustotheca clavata]
MYAIRSYYARGVPAIGLKAFGLPGCALATTITHYTRTITFALYMFRYKQYHATSWPWNWSFLNLRLYFVPLVKVGGPMIVGQFVENWQLQTMAIFAAMTSEVALGANNSMMELIFFLTSPIYGMIDGGSTRMGMHLGAGNAQAARATSGLVFWCIFGLSLLIVIPWFCASGFVGKIFSNDAQVIAMMASISTLAAAGYIIMSLFYYAMATLQAQARTLPIMSSFLIGAWLVGVPSAYIFGFQVQLGLLGIWIGMAVGYLVTTVLGVYFTFKSNWEQEAKKAAARSKSCGTEDTEFIVVEVAPKSTVTRLPMLVIDVTPKELDTPTPIFLSTVYLMPMVKVGGPMVIGQLVENLQLQTISLFAAMTSEGALGANNAMLELFLFLSSPIFGLIDGGSTRISMYLGAGKAQSAKLSSYVVFCCMLGTTILIAIPWLCARTLIGTMFSSDPTISDSLTSISTLAASGYVVMSFFYYSMATLQAQARTIPIMISFLIGAWIVGVPMAYVFGFVLKLGLFGIWMGLCLGYLITTLFGTYFTYKSNWIDEAEKAVARSKVSMRDEAEPFLLDKSNEYLPEEF